MTALGTIVTPMAMALALREAIATTITERCSPGHTSVATMSTTTVTGALMRAMRSVAFVNRGAVPASVRVFGFAAAMGWEPSAQLGQESGKKRAVMT